MKLAMPTVQRNHTVANTRHREASA